MKLKSVTSIKNFYFNKEGSLVLSGWLSNISVGWFGATFVLPLFTDSNRLILLTVNIPSAILMLSLAIWLAKMGK